MSDSNKIETSNTTERNATTSELAEAVQKSTHGFGVSVGDPIVNPRWMVSRETGHRHIEDRDCAAERCLAEEDGIAIDEMTEFTPEQLEAIRKSPGFGKFATGLASSDFPPAPKGLGVEPAPAVFGADPPDPRTVGRIDISDPSRPLLADTMLAENPGLAEVADEIINCPKCESTHYSRLECTPVPTIITPLHAAVLVRPDEAEEFYIEGLDIKRPETSQEQPQEGIIIALPPIPEEEHRYFRAATTARYNSETGKYDTLAKPALQLGTRVIYGKYSGAHVRAGNEDLIRLHVDDILAVVTGPRAAHVRTTSKPKPEPEAAAGPSLIQTPAQMRGEGRIIIP